jgi:hypothetical protein
MRILIAALFWALFLSHTSQAAVDAGVCTAADQSGCTGPNLRVNINEELAAINARTPLLLTGVAGTNTITACATPSITTYVDGQLYQLKPTVINSAAVTLNICGVGSLALNAADGTALVGNELDPAVVYLLRYVASSGHIRVLGPVMSHRFIRNAANYTLGSVTTEQKLFNGSANGSLAVLLGTYDFRCVLHVTTMSATSGNAAFDLQGTGTATLSNVVYTVTGIDGAAATPVTPSLLSVFAAQTVSPMVTATTATELNAVVHGSFIITSTGTIQPAITLAVAAPAVVTPNTRCQFTRLSPAITPAIGPWN